MWGSCSRHCSARHFPLIEVLPRPDLESRLTYLTFEKEALAWNSDTT